MIYSVQQIKFEILGYIKVFGSDFSQWYIGIASRPKEVMWNRHGVDEIQDVWLCRQAVSYRACETIRSFFIDKLKVDGTPAAEEPSEGNWIYVFRKSPRTRPSDR